MLWSLCMVSTILRATKWHFKWQNPTALERFSFSAQMVLMYFFFLFNPMSFVLMLGFVCLFCFLPFKYFSNLYIDIYTCVAFDCFHMFWKTWQIVLLRFFASNVFPFSPLLKDLHLNKPRNRELISKCLYMLMLVTLSIRCRTRWGYKHCSPVSLPMESLGLAFVHVTLHSVLRG